MNARTATKAYRIFDETKRHETKFRFFGFAKQAKFCHTKVFFRWFCFSWNYKKDHRIETVRGMSTGNWTQSRLLTFPLLFISVDCPRMESCYSGHSFCYLYDLYERGCFICYLYDLYGRGCVYLLSIWSLWEGLRLSAVYMISMGGVAFAHHDLLAPSEATLSGKELCPSSVVYTLFSSFVSIYILYCTLE
jgi:hypothetical protein